MNEQHIRDIAYVEGYIRALNDLLEFVIFDDNYNMDIEYVSKEDIEKLLKEAEAERARYGADN